MEKTKLQNLQTLKLQTKENNIFGTRNFWDEKYKLIKFAKYENLVYNIIFIKQKLNGWKIKFLWKYYY